MRRFHARLHVLLDDPDNCVDQQEFVLKIADENGDVPDCFIGLKEDDQNEQTCIYFGSGDFWNVPETYQAILTASSCGQGPLRWWPHLHLRLRPKLRDGIRWSLHEVLEGEISHFLQ